MTFNEGDRIYGTMFDGSKIKGTVDYVGSDFNHPIVWAYWDQDQPGGKPARVNGPCYLSIDKCEHIELKYDPMQQGDKDEDI